VRYPCRFVRLYSRPGNDLTWRFPLIVEALARLRSHSCGTGYYGGGGLGLVIVILLILLLLGKI
jgi:Protein of unknown function (DUF3309)